jgi:hypothetical protein
MTSSFDYIPANLSENPDTGIRLNIPKNGLLGDILMSGDCGKDGVQSSDSERIVRRNCDTVGCGMLGLKDDVTAHLMDFKVFPALAEVLDQFFSAEIAWELHTTASTSSRIR